MALFTSEIQTLNTDFTALRASIDAYEAQTNAKIADLTGQLANANRDLAAAVAAGTEKDDRIADLNGQILILNEKIRVLETPVTPPVVTPPVVTPPVVVPPVTVPPASTSVLYGPKGTAWPHNTPTTPTQTIEVTGDWTAIGKAITSAPDGTLILVGDGTLPGNGAGSTVKPVLQSVGKARAQRVIVRPKNKGGVKFSASIRLDSIQGVSFMGFDLGDTYGVVVTGNSKNWAWGRSRACFFNLTATNSVLSTGEYFDCISPESELYDNDRWAWRTVGAGSAIRDIRVYDSYGAPSYNRIPVPGAKSAHTDTLQLSGDGDFDDIVIDGSALFASTNADFIGSSATSNVTISNSLLVGGLETAVRYPLMAGAEQLPTNPTPVPINGGITNLKVLNSYVTGTIKSVPVSIAGSKLNQTLTLAWLDKVAPKPQ